MLIIYIFIFSFVFMLISNIDVIENCTFPQVLLVCMLFLLGGPFFLISSLLETLLEELYSRWWNKPK